MADRRKADLPVVIDPLIDVDVSLEAYKRGDAKTVQFVKNLEKFPEQAGFLIKYFANNGKVAIKIDGEEIVRDIHLKVYQIKTVVGNKIFISRAIELDYIKSTVPEVWTVKGPEIWSVRDQEYDLRHDTLLIAPENAITMPLFEKISAARLNITIRGGFPPDSDVICLQKLEPKDIFMVDTNLTNESGFINKENQGLYQDSFEVAAENHFPQVILKEPETFGLCVRRGYYEGLHRFSYIPINMLGG